jgi:glycosyltransferase involved in cell wall biosynthesis
VIKVLFIHQARIGSLSATGQLLSLLLEGAEDNFQLYEIASNIDKAPSTFKFWDINEFLSDKNSESLTTLLCDIAPQVIVFRPDDRLIDLTDAILKSTAVTGAKIIGCVMDSWDGSAINSSLQKMFKSSASLWFISEQMEKYYREIYNFTCHSFIAANGVDSQHFQYPKVISKQDRRKLSLRLTFTGSVNLNQTYEGLSSIANVVGLFDSKVKLDIYTRQYETELARQLSINIGVLLQPPIDAYDEYLRKINQAEVLVIPYGWSQKVISFLKYSFGNKIPEYLACGVPVIVIGSEELGSVNYLAGIEGVKVIADQDSSVRQRELIEYFNYLLDNYDYELEKSQQRRLSVLSHFSIPKQRKVLKENLLNAF